MIAPWEVLGFGDSSEAVPETDGRLRESILFARVHGDDRGAALNEYDIALAQRVHPRVDRPPSFQRRSRR